MWFHVIIEVIPGALNKLSPQPSPNLLQYQDLPVADLYYYLSMNQF